MLSVKTFPVGSLETNLCLIQDENTKESAIVDPGEMSEELDQILKNKTLKYILLTHGHFDHIAQAQRYKNLSGAKIVISEKESEFTKNNALNLSCKYSNIQIKSFDADILVKDGDMINLGDTQIKVMETPGHTVGSVCYIADDKIFSGDTVMKECVGRCDLPTGNSKELRKSIRKICSLTRDYTIYPGHGEATTLDYEKQNNLYFRKEIS